MTRKHFKALLALLLCLTMLTASFALAEEAECAHTNKHQEPFANGGFAKYDDPNVEDPAHEHAVYNEIWNYWVCEDCGERFSGVPGEPEFLRTDSHTFVNGKCSQCGYECAHVDAFSNFNYVDLTCENIGDASQHKVVGTRVDYDYCPNCYTRLNETSSPYEDMWPHSFQDGVCQDCGYACTHDEVDLAFVYAGTSYLNVGSQSRHKTTGTKTLRTSCRTCGKVLSEVPADAIYYEEHHFENGVCKDSGYVCPHTNTYTDTETDYSAGNPFTYKDTGDNKAHTEIIKSKKYTYCSDCDMQIGDPVATTVEETREHDYEDGNVCVDCGHVNTCAHSNIEAAYDYSEDWHYEKFDNDEFHHATYTKVYVNHCLDCDKYFYDQIVKREPVTEDRAHDFNNKGVCYDCGYVKNCTHPNAFDRDYDWDQNKYSYEDIGSNLEHMRYSDITTRKYCPDCDRWIGSETAAVEKSKENHDYNSDGYCKLCGHKNACEHLRTYKDTYVKTTTGYTPIDASGHTHNGVLVTALKCQDCGIELEVLSSEEFSENESHEANWLGVCEQCGYKFDCKHANVIKDYDGYFEDTDFTKPYNDKVHRVAGYYCTYDLCQDCGKGLNEHGFYTIRLEPHNFDRNGVCTECGYKRVCEHANLSGWVLGSDGRATYKNIGHRLVHEVTHVQSRKVICLDCGETVEDQILGTETSVEGHTFNDKGVCELCGYVNTCAHANTGTSSYFNGRVSFKDTGSDATHEVRGRRMVTYTYCKDCGATLSETVVPYGTDTEAHDYRNGVCLTCGHINNCAHANTETKKFVVGTVKDSGSNKTHTVKGYQFETVVCKDCGMTLSSKLINRDATDKVEHKYVDGLCVMCGHVKTKEEEKSESTEEEATPMKLVYTPVSENTVVNGVKVADHPTIAEALKTIGESLDKEMASDNVSVEIAGVEKILDKEEKARFDKLPAKDQMLVVLSILGLEDALAEVSDDMSEDAKALADDIAARFAGMSNAEKSALLDSISEFFPKTKVTVDGKTYDAMSLDLIIDRNGDKSYNRYTFYNDDANQWILYSIEEGKYVEAANA